MQFAELVLTAKTEALKQGSRDLDGLRASGEKAEKGVTKSTGAMSEGFGGVGVAAKAMAAAATAALGVFASGKLFGAAIREAEMFETTMFRVEAVIKATNGVAGRSADQLRAQARQLALGTLESTEGVLRAQQTLLTFRNVQGDVFDRAIVAAADMTAALGGDLNSATMQLAKALENPTQGLTALTRSGTVFTEAQKEMVKGMVEAGDTASAQAFILSELEAQYGGTAAAAASGLAGAQDTLAQAMQEFRLELAESLGLTAAATAANNAMARAVNFLADNVDQARGFVIAATATLTVAYTPAIVAATIATGRWVASLVTLRGALMATGIGALVVLGGLAVNKILELREETGSLGGAFTLLGDVTVGVWDGIVTAAEAIVPGLGAVWSAVQADFFSLMSALSEKWSEFLSAISLQLADAPGFGGISERLATSAGEAFGAMSRFDAQARSAERSAAALNAEAAAMAQDGLQAARDALDRLTVQTDGVEDGVTDTSDAITQMTDALDSMEDATKSAGGAVKAADNEASRLTDTLSGPLPSAIDGVSRAWADFVVTGFNDFQGFVSGVLNSFKRMLAEMIATAASSRIMLSVGMTGGAGGAAQAGGGINPMQLLSSGSNMLGGGQMLANVIGGGGLLAGTTFGAGLSATLTGGLSGGLGAFGAGASMGGLSGAGMMAGAAVPVVGAVLGGLALARNLGVFGGKTKVTDQGLQGSFGFGGTDLQSFTNTHKKGGLFSSSKSREIIGEADAGMAAYVSGQAQAIQSAAAAAAATLGIGAEAFAGFSSSFRLSLKDLSEEQAIAAIDQELARMGDGFAAMLPQFSSFNELLGAASERIALTDRLLALQGRDDELLARQRQRELDATHAVNRATLQHIYALEDQAVAAEEAARATAEAARLAEIAAAEEARRRDDFSRRMMGSNLFATSAQRGFAASSYGMQGQPLGAATAEERALLREVVTAIREGNMNIVRHLLEQTRLTERATLEGLA